MLSLKYLLNRFFQSFRIHPWMHGSAIVVLTLTFTIIFTLSLMLKNLETILVTWGSQVEMNIYIQDQLDESDKTRIKNKISNLGSFSKIEYIDKKDAMSVFFQKMSSYVPEFASDKDFLNIIPSSYFATLDQTLPISELSSLASKIIKIKGVEDVSYGQEWLENFSVFLSFLKSASGMISLSLILGGFFTLAFIIYVLIHRRKDEIEILQLCGATPKMIQAPFIFEGFLIACICSSLGLLSSYLLFQSLLVFFDSDLLFLGLSESFVYFSILDMVFILALSLFLSSFLAWICVRTKNSSPAELT